MSDEKMEIFRIPISWEMCGFVNVKAKTITDAIEFVKDNMDEVPLDADGNYIDGSMCLSTDDEEIIKECYNNKNRTEYGDGNTKILY